MRFIDEAEITVKSGDGGAGAVSFRREKGVPRGGPDGGDGGKGGDIIFTATTSLTSLMDFRYKKHYNGQKGAQGAGSRSFGKDGEDSIIRVPLGTIIKDLETEEVLVDLTVDDQEYVFLKGGIGGKGNAHFKSSTNQTPRYSQGGREGEERELKLELKLLADVGIVGFPSCGKSTLISKVSAAKPKIADYPFTTLVPNLGVVLYGGREGDSESFVLADIPGLIEGAHEGKGLGIQFLKHLERTSIYIHMIDLSPDTGRDPIKDYEIINSELEKFNPKLKDKKQVVVLNKLDLTEAREALPDLSKFFKKEDVKVFEISAVTGEGIKDLVNYVGNLVSDLKVKK